VENLLERLQRIEEAQAFAERTVDQLGSEVIRAFEQLVALHQRLDRLEGRVAGVEEAGRPDDAGEPTDAGS